MDGFRHNNATGVCDDVNECAENPLACQGTLVCENLPGSFSCGCGSGFKWSPSRRACEDVNECVIDYGREVYAASVCDENALCVNTVGSYLCECKPGWNKTVTNDYCSGNVNQWCSVA